MIRNLVLVLISLCVGGTLSSLYFSSGQLTKSRNEVELSADHVRAVLRQVTLQVPANMFATGERVVAAEEDGEKIVELASTGNSNRAIVLVTARISFGIATEGSPGLMVETDKERKAAKITIPSPHFLGVADSPEAVVFAVGPVDQGEINQLKNEAIASLHREANSRRYTETAKASCAEQITSVAKAFGYVAEIVWTAPGAHNQSRTPL